MTPLTKAIAHCIWANDGWIRFIDENLPGDEFLLARMSHILLGEQAWFARITGKEPQRDIWRLMTIPQIHEELAKNRQSYESILSGNLDRIIPYKRFTGEEYQSAVRDTLLHLTLHGAHHRGQMATHVSSKGIKPNTDFIQFCLITGQ